MHITCKLQDVTCPIEHSYVLFARVVFCMYNLALTKIICAALRYTMSVG